MAAEAAADPGWPSVALRLPARMSSMRRHSPSSLMSHVSHREAERNAISSTALRPGEGCVDAAPLPAAVAPALRRVRPRRFVGVMEYPRGQEWGEMARTSHGMVQCCEAHKLAVGTMNMGHGRWGATEPRATSGDTAWSRSEGLRGGTTGAHKNRDSARKRPTTT